MITDRSRSGLCFGVLATFVSTAFFELSALRFFGATVAICAPVRGAFPCRGRVLACRCFLPILFFWSRLGAITPQSLCLNMVARGALTSHPRHRTLMQPIRFALVGFHRRDPAKAARDAEKHGVRAFASAEALCASPEVDATFITSPDALHLSDARLAFSRNKPVLCEKPLTSNGADADAMLAAANASGKLFGVAHHYRWSHAVQQIRARVAAGEIGEVRTAHAEFNYAAQFSRRPWITDPTLAAGGPIGDVGVHCLDTLR